MKFKTTSQVERLVKSGTHKNGAWYLYNIKENTKNGTKSWNIFTSFNLNPGTHYEFSGYITESPNKMYQNQQGKHPYQTTYNCETANPIQVSNSGPQVAFNDFGSEPKFNESEDIPF